MTKRATNNTDVAPRTKPCFSCARPVYWIGLQGQSSELIVAVDPKPVPWGDIVLVDSRHGMVLPDTAETIEEVPTYIMHEDVCARRKPPLVIYVQMGYSHIRYSPG